MAGNDLRIKVTAYLDETLSKTQLQNQLDKLSKDLKVTIGIDPKQLKDFEAAMAKIQNQVGGKNKGTKIVNDSDLKASKEIYTSVEHAVEAYKKLGTVKVNKVFDTATGDLKEFNLEVQRADGLIDKLKFKLASSVGMHGVDGFTMTNQTQVDKTQVESEKAISKMLQQRAAEQRKLAEEQAKAANKNLEQAQKEKQKQKEVSEEIKYQISLFQQKMQIEARNLTRRYSDSINKDALNAQMSQIMNVNPASFNSLKEYRRWQEQVSLGFKDIASNARTSSSHVLSFGEAFKVAMQRFPVWMAASTAFFQSFYFIKNGITFVNELNQSLTEISIVTGKSQEQVAKLADEYNRLAQSMGVTTNEIAKASASLYRQGLSDKEAEDRMKTIIQYAKISSLDVSQATEIMTAAINSMGVSAQRASDVWSYLGDATATGSDEIGRAMQKVGGSAGALGINFEKVSSWISVISSRTREGAETIGQSVKSILARVQNMKETGFSEEDGTQVNQVAKALAAVGIQLMDNQGQFRNFGNVLDELGQRWKDLDSRQKAYLSTTVAGTYQQSRFMNLMEGYGETVDLYNKALDSTGTSQAKFNQYMQGTEAKLNELKASIEAVWLNMFNSKGIQVVIDSFTAFTKTIQSIVDHTGALAPVLGVAGIAIIAFNGGLKSIMANGSLVLTTLKGIPLGLTRMDSALAASTLKTRLFAGVTTATSAVVSGFGKAIASTATFLAGAVFPMASFMAVGFAIQKVTEAMAKQREEAKKIKQNQEDIVKSYSTHSKQIDELAKQYESLSARVEDGQLSENSQEYVDNMNSLGKLMPSLVASTNEHGDSILRSRDAVKDELEYAKQLKAEYDKMSVANFEKDLDAQAEKITKINVAIQGFQNQKNGINTVHGGSKPDKGEQIYYDSQILGQERELQLALNNSKDFIKEKAKAFMEMNGVTGDLSESNNKLIESFIQQSIASKKTVKDGEEFKQFLSDTVNEATNLGEKLAKIPESLDGVFSVKQIQGLSDDQINAIKAIDDNLKNGGTGALYFKDSLLAVGLTAKQADTIIQAMTDALKKNSDETLNNTLRQQQLADAIEKATKKYDESVGKIKELSTALNELNKDHELSSESISLLAQKYPELLGYIGNEQALREHLTTLITQEKNTAIDAMNTKLSTSTQYYSQLVGANKQYFDGLANYYEVDLQNVSTVAELKYQVESKLRDKLGDLWASYYDAQAMTFNQAGKDMMSTMSYAEAVNSPQLKAIAEYEGKMKSLSATMRKFTANSGFSAGINTAGLGTPDKDKGNKTTSESTYVSDKFKQALDEVNASIEKQQRLQQQYPNSSKQYQNAVKAEIELQKQKKKLIDDQIASLQKQIDTGKIEVEGKIVTTKIPGKKGLSKADTTKISAEAQKALDEAKSKLLQLQSDSAEVQSNIQNLQLEALKVPMYQAQSLQELADYALSLEQAKTKGLKEGSKEWTANLKNQSVIIKQKIKDTEDEKKAIDELLKSEKVSAAEKENLRKRYKELNLQTVSLTNDLQDLRNTLEDSYNNIADQAIEAEKEYYQQRKQHLDDYYANEKKKIQDVYDFQRKLIDDQENTNDYNKELTKKQKEAQDIQNQINKLSLDDSKESRDKVLELQKQLADKQQEIQDFTHKREIELRKNSLDEQQKLAEDAIDTEQKKWDDYYDNLINDERHWAKVREEVLKGNTKALSTELSTFSTDVQKNMDDLGKSIQQNLIDKIGEAVKALETVNGKSLDSQLPSTTPSIGSSGSTSPTGSGSKSPTTPANSGKLEILKPINLWKRNGDKLEFSRILNPGEKYNVYGYDDKFGGQFNVGGGYWVTDMKGYVKKYHDGGLVGDVKNSRLADLANKLFNVKPGEAITKQLIGELNVPPKNIPNLFTNIKNVIGNVAKGSPSVNTIQFDNMINIEKVDSNVDIREVVKQASEELVRQLKPYGFIR